MITNTLSTVKKKFNFSVSTDIVGLFGNPVHSINFWQHVISPIKGSSVEIGLEVLAWRHLQFAGLSKEPILQQHIAGFHGRIGTRLDTELPRMQKVLLSKKIGLYNSVLYPSLQLVDATEKQFHDRTQLPYILLHEPETSMLLEQGELRTTSKRVPLVVENSVDDPSLQKTKAAVLQLQELGWDACMVFDVVHFLASHNAVAQPRALWQAVLNQFQSPMMIHLPIGLNISDSLPIAECTDEMLKALAEAISVSESYVTIEFQLEGLYPLYAQPVTLDFVTQHAQNWLKRLFECGILH
ncbi:hypothetical protein KBC79_02205 [Candidatus Woesebacteria bacterium]|nr:hypothetical protein [Candidatus Woesebacteria bacterium]